MGGGTVVLPRRRPFDARRARLIELAPPVLDRRSIPRARQA